MLSCIRWTIFLTSCFMTARCAWLPCCLLVSACLGKSALEAYDDFLVYLETLTEAVSGRYWNFLCN